MNSIGNRLKLKIHPNKVASFELWVGISEYLWIERVIEGGYERN